jgi:hypothetical protein
MLFVKRMMKNYSSLYSSLITKKTQKNATKTLKAVEAFSSAERQKVSVPSSRHKSHTLTLLLFCCVFYSFEAHVL